MGISEYKAGIDDPLVQELGRQLDLCRDEMDGGVCYRCPVANKCWRLWLEIANDTTHTLKLREFRQYCQKFHMIREERNCLLARRGIKLAQPVEY